MTDPILKINAKAYDKFLFMRDHKNYEVTMFGITTPENPLHVVDFKLVKQKVNNISSDCDTDYMCEYNEEMYMKHKILPINCERIWCHTHPMTGENSANPSGKDMNTWNDKDNSLKQFYVMLILSKSNHITCKLRIKSNLDKAVPNLNIPIVYERDIKVEVVKEEDYDKKIVECIIRTFGQTCVDKLGEEESIKLLRNKIKLIEIYPEFKELEKEYDKLVSLDVYNNTKSIGFHSNNSHSHYSGFGDHTSRPFLKEKKEIAATENVPEILLKVSEHRVTTNNLSKEDLENLSKDFEFDGQEDLDLAFKDFESNKNNKTNVVNILLGAITSGILTVRNNVYTIDSKNSMMYKRCEAINFAKMTYPEYHSSAQLINKALE